MKVNRRTLALAALGMVSLGGAQADEAQNAVQTALASTTISGYVNTSAILRFGHGNQAPGRSFDGESKQDGFNLDVVKLQIEKPLDESQWSAGYQVGLLFGPDANTYATSSSGVSTSDFGIKDANVTLRAPVGNGLDFKIGYWESPVGYEVFDAGNNPNYSRSYAYSIEPKQFTGVLASYKASDIIKFSVGVANRGWEISPTLVTPGTPLGNTVDYASHNAINERSGDDSTLTYLGSVAITAPESAGFLEGATIYAGIIDSGVANGPDVLNWYVGGTMPTPVEGLLFGGAYDYRSNDSSDRVSSAYASAVAGYLSYQLTQQMRLNGRVEYATGSNNTWYYRSDSDNNQLLGVTATLDYNLWANALTRLEFRWDHSLDGHTVFGDGTAENALSLALNVIFKF